MVPLKRIYSLRSLKYPELGYSLGYGYKFLLNKFGLSRAGCTSQVPNYLALLLYFLAQVLAIGRFDLH